MNDKTEQKHENEEDSMIDLEVTSEQADQARAGTGAVQPDSEYKYVPIRRPVDQVLDFSAGFQHTQGNSRE